MIKVLIVEDDEINIKLATELLKVNGYDVLQARNGLDGIKIAKEAKPDIILMDIEMPKLDGLEAMKQLKADPETQQIKIIAVTARAMVGDEAKIRAAGADDYVSKPYRYSDLISAIKKYCV